MDIFVSVIIPTYNRKEIVVDAIVSVLNQDYKDFEVIVIDDGSTDGTTQYLLNRFPDIRLITQKNKGVSNARNIGIVAAKGNYIAFLDSDDRWLANKLTRQIQYIKKYPDYNICHTEEIWYRNGIRVNPMKKHQDSAEDLFLKSLKGCIISTSSVLIKKQLFDDVGLYDESLPACEDYDLWLRITAKYKILFLAEKLVIKHGGGKDQLSKKYWGMDRFRIKSLEKLFFLEYLNREQKHELRNILQEKLKIFINGAIKHNNINGIKEYKIKYYNFFGKDSFYNRINV